MLSPVIIMLAINTQLHLLSSKHLYAEGPVFNKTEQVSDILNTAMCLQDYNIYKTVYQIYTLVIDDLSGDWLNLCIPET